MAKKHPLKLFHGKKGSCIKQKDAAIICIEETTKVTYICHKASETNIQQRHKQRAFGEGFTRKYISCMQILRANF